MGLDIFVTTTEKRVDCDFFIDRNFLNFIMTDELFGEQSFFNQLELTYEIDLKFLTKLDGTDIEYKIGQKNLEYDQNIDFALLKLNTLKKLIDGNPRKILNSKYTAYDESKYDNEFMENIEEENIKKMFETQKKELLTEMKNNPRPWDTYVTEKVIIKDIQVIIDNLLCLMKSKCKTFYFRIG